MKTLQQKVEKVGKGVLSLFYPLKCPFCERLMEGGGVRSCPECKKKLPYIQNPRCYQCGKPLRSKEAEYCMDCIKKQHYFTQGLALWSYDATIKKAVYRFKYKNQRRYAGYFARELAGRYGRQIRSWNADVIIPVPIHKKRYRQRGYNQAELLAQELGAYIQIPVETKLVTRIKNTRPQKELNDKERQKNLKSAFKINENGVKLRKVIIVDDIYTTGATVDVLAELLLESGISDVYVITLCIGKGY